MPLNIKTEEAHRLAKELSKLTGKSITEAVTIAIRKELMNEVLKAQKSQKRLIAELNAIALDCSSLEVLDDRTADEIIDYDSNGLPV